MSELLIVRSLEGMLDEVCVIEQASFGDPWSRTAFETSAGAAYCLPFAALLGEELVGYALVYNIAGSAELVNIAVSPCHRGKGIGRALLTAAINGATEAGAKFLRLEVRSSNATAQSLYKKAGFFENGTRKNYYTNPREDAMLMELSLDDSCSDGGNHENLCRRNDNLC